MISAYTKERLSAAKFTTPTPVQAAAIPQALEGKDVLAEYSGDFSRARDLAVNAGSRYVVNSLES